MVIVNVTIDDISKQLFLKLTNPIIIADPISAGEIIELRELRNHIRDGISENVVFAESFLRIQKIDKLSKYIPNVKIHY